MESASWKLPAQVLLSTGVPTSVYAVILIFHAPAADPLRNRHASNQPVDMVLLGDLVPDFSAESTKGPVESFHKYCEVSRQQQEGHPNRAWVGSACRAAAPRRRRRATCCPASDWPLHPAAPTCLPLCCRANGRCCSATPLTSPRWVPCSHAAAALSACCLLPLPPASCAPPTDNHTPGRRTCLPTRLLVTLPGPRQCRCALANWALLPSCRGSFRSGVSSWWPSPATTSNPTSSECTWVCGSLGGQRLAAFKLS